jgi:hypothetical protein
MSDVANFTKNLALLGAVCFIAAIPEPWPGAAGRQDDSAV